MGQESPASLRSYQGGGDDAESDWNSTGTGPESVIAAPGQAAAAAAP